MGGGDNFSEEEENDWRNILLKQILTENNVNYIWSKDLIKRDGTFSNTNIKKFIHPDNGHPTTYFNTLVSNEIKKIVLKIDSQKNRALSKNNVEYFIQSIKSDKSWFDQIKKKASKKNISINEMLERDAKYLINKYKQKYEITESYNLNYFSDLLNYTKERIKNDSAWMNHVKEKAYEQNISNEESIMQEALYYVKHYGILQDTLIAKLKE